MEYVVIIVSAIFVNNIVLSQLLGIFPLPGESTKTNTVIAMAASMLLVTTMATIITFMLNQYVLIPLNLPFLKTISFILIITIMVQMLEMIFKKAIPSLYQVLGIYLPLIITNSAVLGVALLVIGKHFNLAESVVYAAASSLGYGLVLILFSGIREQLALANIPKGMAGIPIALVTAGILALAFMGFAGLV